MALLCAPIHLVACFACCLNALLLAPHERIGPEQVRPRVCSFRRSTALVAVGEAQRNHVDCVLVRIMWQCDDDIVNVLWRDMLAVSIASERFAGEHLRAFLCIIALMVLIVSD